MSGVYHSITKNQCPRLARFEAVSGFTLVWVPVVLEATWVARLQLPFFHLAAGSGQAAQNHPADSSV